MMIGEQYNIGDTVLVTDQITCLPRATATVKYVEQDNEIPELYWVYLVVGNVSLNDKFDPNPYIGNYWEVMESFSPYLSLS